MKYQIFIIKEFMKKVIKINENDIENLVKKILREDGEGTPPQKQEKVEKPISLVKLNRGELSTIDDIIRTVQQAKMAFEDLCNSKLTGNDGYSKEIDGIVNDFTKLEDKVRKSKETVSNFMVQNRERNKVDHMRQRNTDYMKKREDAEKNGRYYA